MWQNESIKRCKDKQKGEAYRKYITWNRKESEIAVFTLYAYADFKIPKLFDIIFHLDNPQSFHQIEYKITQSIFEAWFPSDDIHHGHKHLCVFSFDTEIPVIFDSLHTEQNMFSTSPKGQKSLGFCSSKDFAGIAKTMEKKSESRRLYGDKWWEHDDGQ